ncbi:MAG: Crp/Fnr family transcriptional regulator [Flavobacteriaceae bacterium]
MLATLENAYGQHFESRLLQEITQVGAYRDLRAGAVLFESGQFVTQIPLLLEGNIKILREYEDGGSLLLHYIEKGDAGSMLMTHCWGTKASEVKAVAELDSRMIMIPKRQAQQWMSQYADWQRFILSNHALRMRQIVGRLEATAFGMLEKNVWEYLREKSRIHQKNTLSLTHDQIARELKSSRVVVSRILKKLEGQQQLSLHRSKIVLNT